MRSILGKLKAGILLLGWGILSLFWGGGNALAAPDTATAIIYSTAEPSERLGVATFVPTDGGLQISVALQGVAPGEHGFHIHEVGNCDDGGMAAKGHFNPDGVKHGYLLEDGFENAHAGDLGNIAIAPDGTGTLNLTLEGLSLDEGRYAVRGRSAILHEKRDNPNAQPTGDAGGRIGCGAIDGADP